MRTVNNNYQSYHKKDKHNYALCKYVENLFHRPEDFHM